MKTCIVVARGVEGRVSLSFFWEIYYYHNVVKGENPNRMLNESRNVIGSSKLMI